MPELGIIYYYVLYRPNGEIHLRPFETKDEAKEYKEKADKHFQEINEYKFSRIMKKNLDKYGTELWM